MTQRWHLAAEVTANQTQNWLWLPGWSYRADIFAPLMAALPGRHWAGNYLCQHTSLTDMAAELADSAPDTHTSTVWIGWSLGGALAVEAATRINQSSMSENVKVVTLGCGRRFLADSDGHGMPATDFDAFRDALAHQPGATLKRFTALCANGADNARKQIRSLAAAQLPPSLALEHTLSWLDYAALPDQLPDALHIYGQNDALSPGGLTPTRTSHGSSHAFFLTDSGHAQLVNLLTGLTGDSDGTS